MTCIPVRLRPAIAAGATALALTVGASSAFAAAPSTTVNVQLIDKPNQAMATGLIYGAPSVNLAKATDIVKPSATGGPAGSFIFNVTNTSKDMVHEMIVVAIPANAVGKPLPYNASQHMVDESKIKSVGEVSELDAGKSGKLTVSLTRGTYILLCNQPGHYEAGMWAVFTVK